MVWGVVGAEVIKVWGEKIENMWGGIVWWDNVVIGDTVNKGRGCSGWVVVER